VDEPKPKPYVPSKHQLILRLKASNRHRWEPHLVPPKLKYLRDERDRVSKEKDGLEDAVHQTPQYKKLEKHYNDLYRLINKMEEQINRDRQELIDLLLINGPTPEIVKRIEKFLGIKPPKKKAKDANASSQSQSK
jgi:hypothetical protein